MSTVESDPTPNQTTPDLAPDPSLSDPDPPQRTPLEEIAKRTAEAGAGLRAAAGAVGLEAHRRQLKSHDARVDDSYQVMREVFRRAAGLQTGGSASDDPGTAKDDDTMGDIIVTGDLTFHGSQALDQATQLFKGKVVKTAQASPPSAQKAPADAPGSTQTSAPNPQPNTPPAAPVASGTPPGASTGVNPLWKTAAIVGGSLLAGTGVGGATAALVMNQAAPAVVAPAIDTDTNSRLEFHDDPPPPSGVPAARRQRPDRSI